MKYNLICTECDTEYDITDDDDLDIEPNYCPYCSKPIYESPPTDPLDDDDELDV
jgi:DNA-directed RNA polymerase subunit RPC12/RpoP|tara:strand:+ start:163 stop:324 length:162 start_codon:yes stop_codon:yes gene_type:complete